MTLADGKTITSKSVIITGGIGSFKPRPLPAGGEWEGRGLVFFIPQPQAHAGKDVVIVGGGDSALDWAKEISRVTDSVHLVHRRREFRGNFETIKDIKEIKIHTPYMPSQLIIEDNRLLGVSIKHAEEESYVDLFVDYILVNFGNVPSPVAFSVPKQNTGIICDEHRCVLNRVYVAGDAIGVPGKIKRIGDGLKDADSVLKTILKF